MLKVLKLRPKLGFSLLELLIALAVSALLLQIALINYSAIKKMALLQHVSSQTNHNLRVASLLLWQNIMQAGSLTDSAMIQKVANPATLQTSPSPGLCGYTSKNLPTTLLTRKVVAGTDLIEITKNSYRNPHLTEKMLFFIGITSRQDATKKRITALYMLVNNREIEELVPDVIDMQIEYGLEQQGTWNYWTSSDVTTHRAWHRIAVVIIQLKFLQGTKVITHRLPIKIRSRG